MDANGTTFYLTDALGSVLGSFSNVASGAAVKGTQVFGPYGKARYAKGTINTAKGFTGQYNDGLTGLDYYNARSYDPVAGVFLSADSVQGNGQGMNPYGYVQGNPETWSDPSGRYVVGVGGETYYPGVPSNPAKQPNRPAYPCAQGEHWCAGKDPYGKPFGDPRNISFLRRTGVEMSDEVIGVGKAGLDHIILDLIRLLSDVANSSLAAASVSSDGQQIAGVIVGILAGLAILTASIPEAGTLISATFGLGSAVAQVLSSISGTPGKTQSRALEYYLNANVINPLQKLEDNPKFMKTIEHRVFYMLEFDTYAMDPVYRTWPHGGEAISGYVPDVNQIVGVTFEVGSYTL